MTFFGMYRLIHIINKRTAEANCQSVEVGKQFFRDLEKVFDEVAEVVAWRNIMDGMKEDDG